MNPQESTERERQLRRTRAVRRGVVAAGATGALGAALVIGTTIGSSGTTSPDDPADPTVSENNDHGWTGQSPQPDQLAAPGGGGPAQGRSGGS